MGFFTPGSEAAAGAGKFSQEALDVLRAGFIQSEESLDPFVKAGQFALPDVIQGTTPGGLDARLAEIFGTGAFESLVGERTRAVEGQLAAGGLTRSGTAIQEAANIPTDIGFALEQLLTERSRNLAGSGLSAAGGTAELGAQTSTNIANLLQRQGQDVASGILTDRQTQASVFNTVANIASIASKIFF